MKPVCVPCRRFFQPKRNGFYFLEGAPLESKSPPGNEAPDQWRPYKLWAGDLYECKGCGAQIVSGFGNRPIAIQHEEDFTETVKAYGGDQLQVNDC